MGQVMNENSEWHWNDNGVREKACVGKGNDRQGCEVCHQCLAYASNHGHPPTTMELVQTPATCIWQKGQQTLENGAGRLGNRYKNMYGVPFVGSRVSELSWLSPMLYCCVQQYAPYGSNSRLLCIEQRLNLKVYARTVRSLRPILGGDGSGKAELLDRGRKMVVILEAWLTASESYGLENALGNK